MKLFRTVLALLVVGGFALCAMQGEVHAQKKKGSFGKVTEIKKDSITIETGKKDEKVKKTFKVNDDTKYKKAPTEKGGKATDATAADVKVGSNVFITTSEDGGTALTITVAAPKKKDA